MDQYISFIQKNCPGLVKSGQFTLSDINDFSETAPQSLLEKGGAVLSMAQDEMLSVKISSSYPVAIKFGKDDINLISGKQWRAELLESPGDYLISNKQPWLDDSFLRRRDIGRFVDISLCENNNCESKFGEMKIILYPMKAEVYDEIESMKLAPGSKSMPEIDNEYLGIDAWDVNYVEMRSVYLMEVTE